MTSHSLRYIISVLYFLSILPIFAETIGVGSNPVAAVVYEKKLYVVNSDSNTVSVIDTVKKEVKTTIPVGLKPLSATVVGKSVYVGNSEGSTMTVIDTQKDEVSMTINIPKGLVYIFSSGIYIYAVGNDHITVVDATKNIIHRTTPTKWTVWSSFPTFYTSDNRLFVHHPGDVFMTMIYGSNGTMTFINVWYATKSWAIISKKLYSVNTQLSQVHISDVNKLASPIVSNGIPIVIPVGKEPIQSLALGTKIYVNNAGDNTVSVIDAVKNSVIKTIPVGIRPLFMTFSGRILFVLNNQDNTISMIDTSTDTVVKTLSSGGVSPVFAISNGGNFYVLNAKSNSVNIFDINIPQIIGMNVVEAAGKYSQNNSLTIRATFDKELIPGSSMRLTLDTNRVILLDTVEGKNLTGVYTIWSGENTSKLMVKSIDLANIKNNSEIPWVSYAIPDKKNIWDSKIIVIDTSTTSTPILSKPELLCKNTGMYRLCPLSKAPENSAEYRENMICEWFVSEEQSRSKRVSRIEVLNIAVNMLRGEKSAAADYNNTYTDITPAGNSQETVAVIQTGLDNGLIFPNNGAFEPTKKIPRIEAYALLMRGVCMYPVEGEDDMARAIHQKAIQENITTKQWARFRPYSGITRNEVFIVASALADWADKHGGCDKLECRK